MSPSNSSINLQQSVTASLDPEFSICVFLGIFVHEGVRNAADKGVGCAACSLPKPPLRVLSFHFRWNSTPT